VLLKNEPSRSTGIKAHKPWKQVLSKIGGRWRTTGCYHLWTHKASNNINIFKCKPWASECYVGLWIFLQVWSVLLQVRLFHCFSRSCWIRKEAALFTSSIRSHTSSTAPPSPYAFFLAALGLNSGSQACYVGTLALEPHPHCFLALVIFQIGSCAFCSGQPQPAILLIPPK
jgi:hypothetical protein